MEHEKKSIGNIYMIPCPIMEGKIESLSKETIDVLHGLTHFIVEKAKTARRFIKSTYHPIPLQELNIFEIDKNHPENGLKRFLEFNLINDVGVLSEAGCPGIADPGAAVALIGHSQNRNIIPLIGPSSILLALIASGLNGQNFAFNGYLSFKKDIFKNQLKKLEQHSFRNKQTQIFMETPYRNDKLIENLMQTLNQNTQLCIAANINSKNEWIKTKTISEWKKYKIPSFHKQLVIYLIYRTN